MVGDADGSPLTLAVVSDELGLLVLDSIPGWQYAPADPAFEEQAIRTCRDMIRRDRNHPSVLAWECSLNESPMPDSLVRRLSHAFRDRWKVLGDALAATPLSRFRVATDGRPVGYAITGRAGRRGYLQRLAVDPDHHRRGIGVALVADSLRWLRRAGASAAVVNTQVGNDGALALYLATGFVPEPHGLTVLSHGMAEPPA